MVLTNSLKKNIRSLQQLKFRQKYNKFIAEGPKICTEYLQGVKYEIEHIICTEDHYAANEELLRSYSGKTIICNDKDLEFISALKHPNKILIVGVGTDNRMPNDVRKGKDWVIYLDDIRDPGNMGTIIRIADWFGIKWIISSPDSVDYYNPKVIQSSMGSHNRVGLFINELNYLHKYYKDSYGMYLDGAPLNKTVVEHPGILIIGNEARGINPKWEGLITNKVKIEGRGGAESLNASIACAIACYRLLN